MRKKNSTEYERLQKEEDRARGAGGGGRGIEVTGRRVYPTVLRTLA